MSHAVDGCSPQVEEEGRVVPDVTGPISAEELQRSLPSLIHDLRGTVTALTAFTHLLGEREEAQTDPVLRSCVDGVAVNAEAVASTVEALDILREPYTGRLAPLAVTLPQVAARLSVLLARSGVALNLPGSFPDRSVERRCLAAAVDCLVRRGVKVLARSKPAQVVVSVAMTESSTLLTLRFEPHSSASPAGGRTLASSLECLGGEADFTGLVLRTALARMNARMTVRTTRGEALALLALPVVESRRATSGVA